MLPEEIRELRARRAWTMSQLARELGVSAELIVDWESGERFPTKKHFVALTQLRARAKEDSD